MSKEKKFCSSLDVLYIKLENVFSTHTGRTLGKLLTIIDAITTDKEQRKALKDLIKQTFFSGNKDFYSDFQFEMNMYSKAKNDKFSYTGELSDPNMEFTKNPYSEENIPNV